MKVHLLTVLALGILSTASFASPSTMTCKAKVLKSNHKIKENNRGYVEAIESDKKTKACVETINKKRKAKYEKIAKKDKVSLEAVEATAAERLASR